MKVAELMFVVLAVLCGLCMGACGSPQDPDPGSEGPPPRVPDLVFLDSDGAEVDTLDFGSVAVGVEERSYIWIANVGNELFKFREGGIDGSPSFTSDPDLATFEWILVPGGEDLLQVRVSFRPTEAGLEEGTLWLEDKVYTIPDPWYAEPEDSEILRESLPLRGRGVRIEPTDPNLE